jgi:hypothetical protein
MTPVNPRLRTLRGRFVALIAASATVIGLIAASAVPARADPDSEDIAKLLFGIATVAIIANELKRKNDRDNDDDDRNYWLKYKDKDKPVIVIPKHRRDEGRRIPGDCAIEVRGLRHDRIAYSESCLASYGFRNLPRYCAVQARIYGHPDRLYPASCLAREGYRVNH